MIRRRLHTGAAVLALIASTLLATPAAQVGKGLLDANTAADTDLVTVPHDAES
jgi:hypothetical protein